VVTRRAVEPHKMRDALLRLPGGTRKWRMIERLGPMEPAGNVFVQRIGLSLSLAEDVLRRTTSYGHIPDPLRTAHLIAGGVTTGQSRGRA
jgi:uncharacterized protein